MRTFIKRQKFFRKVVLLFCLVNVYWVFNMTVPKSVSSKKLQKYLSNAWTDVKDFIKPPDPKLYNVSWQLPWKFDFIINQPNICRNVSNTTNGELLLVTIVPSAVTKETARNMIRGTWGSVKGVNKNKILTLFLVSANETENIQLKKLEKENNKYGDLIVGNFVDEYKNLTLKTIMALRWMATYCQNAKYMLKTDDDAFVDYKNLADLLVLMPPSNVAVGHLMDGQKPTRKPRSKWYMPRELFQNDTYPMFLSGTGYVISQDVVQKTYNISLHTPLLYLEDVYLGVCWQKLNIKPMDNTKFHKWKSEILEDPCILRDTITAHRVSGVALKKIWKMSKDFNFDKCPSNSAQ